MCWVWGVCVPCVCVCTVCAFVPGVYWCVRVCGCNCVCVLNGNQACHPNACRPAQTSGHLSFPPELDLSSYAVAEAPENAAECKDNGGLNVNFNMTPGLQAIVVVSFLACFSRLLFSLAFSLHFD